MTLLEFRSKRTNFISKLVAQFPVDSDFGTKAPPDQRKHIWIPFASYLIDISVMFVPMLQFVPAWLHIAINSRSTADANLHSVTTTLITVCKVLRFMSFWLGSTVTKFDSIFLTVTVNSSLLYLLILIILKPMLYPQYTRTVYSSFWAIANNIFVLWAKTLFESLHYFCEVLLF